MESHGRSSSRLKDRLARVFRSPSFLRSTCNISTSAASRCILNDVARSDDGSLCRSLSFPVRNDLDTFPSAVGLPRRLSVDCRLRRYRPPPPQTTTTEKKEEEEEAVKEEEAEEEDKNERKKKNKKRLLSNGYGFSSTSSGGDEDEDDAGGLFSSEDEGGCGGRKPEADETTTTTTITETTLLSSRSFSSDSSEFYQNPKNKNKNKKPPPHRVPSRRGDGLRRPSRRHVERGWGVCRGLRAPPAVVPLGSSAAERYRRRREEEDEEERRKRGFAVVKRSRDPYGDFRRSMVEMIMERQIFGGRELENLLRSYLCLNSPHLHLVILQAFSDIWDVLFGH